MSENKLKVAHDQLKALQGVASKSFEDGAQVNKIEAITVDGVVQTVKNKTAALNLSNYAKKTDLNALAKKSELGIFSTVPRPWRVQFGLRSRITRRF